MKAIKTVYIGGKITGDPGYRDKFSAAAQALTRAGYIPVNPALLPNEGLTWEACMRMCIAMVSECDAVCLLPDWRDSRGATIECAVAREQGKEALPLAEWLDMARA